MSEQEQKAEFTAKAALAYLVEAAVYSDSYGVQGSEFSGCFFCNAGGAPGVHFEHDKECPVLRCEPLAQQYWDEDRERNAELDAASAREAALREALTPFADACERARIGGFPIRNFVGAKDFERAEAALKSTAA